MPWSLPPTTLRMLFRIPYAGAKRARLDRRAPGPRGTCLEHFLEKRERVRAKIWLIKRRKTSPGQVSGPAGPHLGSPRPNFTRHRLAAVRFRRWRVRRLRRLDRLAGT